MVFSWHPGRSRDTAQEVEVTFTGTGGGTRVDLLHHGWERAGESAAEMRENYQTGWDPVMRRFGELAATT